MSRFVSFKYALYDVESSFLIKVGLCPVYRVGKKKYQEALLSDPDIVLASDIESFQHLLSVDDNKTIIISSYVANLELLEELLLEAPTAHRIFFETYNDSSRKPFKMS